MVLDIRIVMNQDTFFKSKKTERHELVIIRKLRISMKLPPLLVLPWVVAHFCSHAATSV